MMKYSKSSRITGHSEGPDGCLVCSEALSVSRRRPIKIPIELGGKPVNAFSKICEILQVPFLEIQNDWNIDLGTGGLPFCLSCFSGFHSIVKLQQQLIDIQKQIEDKITGFREQIQKSQLDNSTRSQQDPKVEKFRFHVLNHGLCDASASFTASTILNCANNNDIQKIVTPPFDEKTLSSSSPQSTALVNTSASIPICPAENNLRYINEISESVSTGSNSVNYKQDYDNNDSYYGGDDAGDAVDHDNNNFSSGTDSEEEDSTKPPVRQKGAVVNNRTNYNQGILATLFPPPIEIRKETSTSNKGDESSRERQPETFSPVFNNADGAMVFEGIIITPVENGYKCGQCGAIVGNDTSSKTLRKAQIHIKGVHLDAYKCHICQRKYASNHILSQHIIRTHESGDLFCPTCSRPLKHIQCAKSHQFTHLNSEEKKAALAAGYKKRRDAREPTLPCRICGKKFDKQSKLKKHEVTHVPVRFRKDYKCQHCDKTFATNDGRMDHIFAIHNPDNARRKLCKTCGESVILKQMKSHMARHLASTCKFCEKTFVSEKVYLVHAETCGKPHNKQDDHKYECDICNKFLRTSSSLSQHRRNVHKSHWKLKVPSNLVADVSVDNPREQECLDDLNNEGIQHVKENIYSYQLHQIEKLSSELGGFGYRCCTCLAEFQADDGEMGTESLEEQVKTHIKSKHLGSFRCNRCTKRFSTLFDAVAHKDKEHLNRETCDCEICGRSGIGLPNMKEHLWKHKNVWEVAQVLNTGETFPARYTTSKTESLLRAMGVQLNFKCILCNKEGFSTTERLYNHRVSKHPDAPVLKSVTRHNKPRGSLKRTKEPKEVCVHPRKRKAKCDDFSDNEIIGKGTKRRYCMSKRRNIKVVAEEDGSDSEEEIFGYLDCEYYFDNVRRMSLRDRGNMKKRLQSPSLVGNYSEYSELESSDDED